MQDEERVEEGAQEPEDDLRGAILPSAGVRRRAQKSRITDRLKELSTVNVDPGIMHQLLRQILDASGYRIADVARFCGIHRVTVSRYLTKPGYRPSLYWFVRFVLACGGRVILEMPREHETRMIAMKELPKPMYRAPGPRLANNLRGQKPQEEPSGEAIRERSDD